MSARTTFQGAIIAAGRGERLRASGGATLPKPLVEVGGEAMLARQARSMLAAGASEVIAVISRETASLAGQTALPRSLQIVVRDTPSSMESLFTIGERLTGQHFLLATVDAFWPNGELARFTAAARKMTDARVCDGALAVVRWRGDVRPLFTHVTSQGLIEEIGERPATMVTAGAYWLPRTIFTLVDRARSQKLGAMRSFLALLVNEGTRLRAIEVAGAIDIDEAADLAAARRQVENRR